MTWVLDKLAGGQELLIRQAPGAAFARWLSKTLEATRRPVVVLVDDAKRAADLADEIRFFSPAKRVVALTPYDVLPYHGLSPHPRVMSESIQFLMTMAQGQFDVAFVPARALLRRTWARSFFESIQLTLRPGFRSDRDYVISELVDLGYERSPIVEEPGQFAVRGDILDVFSPQSLQPVRVSFFDRDVESLKFFEVATQRTSAPCAELVILPTREILLRHIQRDEALQAPEIRKFWKRDLKSRADARDVPKPKRDQLEDFVENGIHFHGIESFLPLFFEKTGSLFDYIPEKTVFVRDMAALPQDAARDFLTELRVQHAHSTHIESVVHPEELFLTPDEMVTFLQKHALIHHERAYADGRDFETLDLQCESNSAFKTKLGVQISKVHNLSPLAEELNVRRRESYQCFIVCQGQAQIERVKDLLSRFEIPLALVQAGESGLSLVQTFRQDHADSRVVGLVEGLLHEGFLSHSEHEWWVADEDIFGRKTRRAKSTTRQESVFSSFADLSDGDYVIHLDHGIGVYKGLVKLAVDPNQNDLLTIEYLGGDKLYVPVDRLDRVQRFAAEDGVVPMLDKLGGLTWVKVRQKARKAAKKLAAELLRMQAAREAQRGYAFRPHHEEMAEFSGGFDFEETPDQERAIADVLSDMGGDRPMDRLVCGDVGFGKTEVAIRASYKCVLDQKQVAVLVPTTVLAFQHYRNFKQRFENYGLRVELLSRFRSEAEIKKVLQDLKTGGVDIVVGTHRLISQDVKFRDLGLLVIDEEHRFGVIHKEKIKKMKALVDVMTLTATPIPRTLNFALNGIRDLSIINTPPIDRLAVKTYVCGFDEFTLRDAMLKELRRGGQIYFVHNRVQSIEKIATQVQKWLPEARVRFAHGQMDESKLEDIMIAFMNHEFDVLVCTTIIESGLDIPNANTMVINRADGLGLAQLYQLRGRVGRSHHQAYCYLVVPDEDLVNAKAKKRLAAIQRFTELGSGFKIASHDLEIRGAGNILGDEQSGQIAAVGYDMYVHLLREAIAELKDELMPEDFSPEVLFNMPAKIPEDYVGDAQLRLLLYKEISSAESPGEVDQIFEDWTDRFGPVPESTKNLARMVLIRQRCKKLLITQIKQSGSRLSFSFHAEHRVNTSVLAKAVQSDPKRFSVLRDGQFCVQQSFPTPQSLLDWIEDFLGKIAG